MRKPIFCLGVMLFVVYVLASCSRVGERIVLPEAGDVSEVTVINGGQSVTAEDAGYIAGLLQEMGKARDTGRESVQDRPEGEGILQVDFTFRKGGVSTVFLYRKGNRVILEQPYQGIFEAETDLLDFLWE